MEKLIIGIVFCALTVICGGLGLLQFLGKGLLLNNAYVYATKAERKAMNKKPHYKQSGVTFSLLACSFLFLGLRFLLDTAWLYAVAAIALAATLFYAIVSSIRSSR